MDLQIKKGQTFGMWTCEPHVTGVHLIDISVCHRQHGQQQTSSLISLIFSRCRPIFSYLNFHSPNSAWPLIICLLPNLLICLTFWLPLPTSSAGLHLSSPSLCRQDRWAARSTPWVWFGDYARYGPYAACLSLCLAFSSFSIASWCF